MNNNNDLITIKLSTPGGIQRKKCSSHLETYYLTSVTDCLAILTNAATASSTLVKL